MKNWEPHPIVGALLSGLLTLAFVVAIVTIKRLINP